MDICAREDLPLMTQEELREHADAHLINGVAFAIANSGVERTNELAQLLGVMGHPDNPLIAVGNIVKRFKAMEVEMDLLDGKKEFTCRLTFEMRDRNDVLDPDDAHNYMVQ